MPEILAAALPDPASQAAQPLTTLNVPVKPYVRKFLLKHLGQGYELRQDDAYGRQLMGLMQAAHRLKRREKGLHRFKSVFEVKVNPNRLRKRGAGGLTNMTVVHFNSFAERVCAQEFHSLADIYTQELGRTIQQAIERFREKFGLEEDDWDEMTMRRSYIRYRKGEEAKGVVVKKCPSKRPRNEYD